jgi:hypothetical protein
VKTANDARWLSFFAPVPGRGATVQPLQAQNAAAVFFHLLFFGFYCKVKKDETLHGIVKREPRAQSIKRG